MTTASALALLVLSALASAVAAARYRLPAALLPATLALSFGLLFMPALSAVASQNRWLTAISLAGGAVALTAGVWAWRTRSAQLPVGWWRAVRRGIDGDALSPPDE